MKANTSLYTLCFILKTSSHLQTQTSHKSKFILCTCGLHVYKLFHANTFLIVFESRVVQFPFKKKKLSIVFFFFFLDLRILRWFQMCYHYELCHTTNRPNIIPHTYNIWTNRLEFIAAGGKLMLFRIWWWQSQFLWMVSACVWGIWICWGEFGGFAHCVYIQKKYIGGSMTAWNFSIVVVMSFTLDLALGA